MGYAQSYGVYMSTAYFDSNLGSASPSVFSQLQTVVIEPLLVVAVGAFWLVALPFVAVSLVGVKIWDALVALKSSNAARPNPLILRQSRPPKNAPALSSPSPVRTGHL
jgi:hypothetical protein